MNKIISKKIAASIAVIFSLLTIVEGSQVLLGMTQPAYIVLTPLLIYNVFMGFVGIMTGVALWMNHKKAVILIKIVAGAHFVVLLTIGVIYLATVAVAIQSVQAMSLRVVIWLIIALVAWRTNNANKSKYKTTGIV